MRPVRTLEDLMRHFCDKPDCIDATLCKDEMEKFVTVEGLEAVKEFLEAHEDDYLLDWDVDHFNDVMTLSITLDCLEVW